METVNQLFGSWVDTQNKLVENWVETTKKYQSALTSGDAMQKSVDLYRDWYESQKSIMGEIVEKTTDQVSSVSPDYVKTWIERQKEFSDKWVEMMNSMAKQPAFNNEQFLTESKKMYENWLNIYNQSFGKMADGAQYAPGTMAKDLYANLFQQSKSYMDMMEFWKPFYKMISENNLNVEEYTKWFNNTPFATEQFQKVMQNMMGFMMPNANKDFFGQFSNFSNAYRDAFRTFDFPLRNIYEQYTKMMPSMWQHDFDSVYKLQAQMGDQMKKVYEPFAKMMPASPAREWAEGLGKMQEQSTLYQAKYAEMQYLISTASYKALEHTVKTLFEQAKAGAKAQTFQDFNNTWINGLEAKMIELFNGEHFSRLQGELLDLGLDIKIGLEKNLEAALLPYPVAPRSEVDALQKQIHDLKAKVKSLEKKMDGGSSEIEETTSTAKKKTAK